MEEKGKKRQKLQQSFSGSWLRYTKVPNIDKLKLSSQKKIL